MAPENPYPRPTEEVLVYQNCLCFCILYYILIQYVYAWMLKNPEKFGWTGEKICMVGDSAGGNLITSVCLRLIELNAARLPDGIVPIYTPFLFQVNVTPHNFTSKLLYIIAFLVVFAVTFTHFEFYGSTTSYGCRYSMCCG